MILGAITSASIWIDGNPQLVNRNSLEVGIAGITTGARATSVTWRRNGSMITTGGGFFIGGGETRHTGNPPCASQMYRVALHIAGYLPGNYTYTVDNAETRDPGVTSSFLEIQGLGFVSVC